MSYIEKGIGQCVLNVFFVRKANLIGRVRYQAKRVAISF